MLEACTTLSRQADVDALAILIAVVCFAVFYLLIEGLDRV